MKNETVVCVVLQCTSVVSERVLEPLSCYDLDRIESLFKSCGIIIKLLKNVMEL